MAGTGKINLPHTAAGATIKMALYGDDAGKMWNGSAFVDISAIANTAAWRSYLIDLTEETLADATATEHYVGDFPAAVSAGLYIGYFYSGAAPSPGDRKVGTQDFVWDGTTMIIPLVASDIRTALGMASANLDTQLDGKATAAALTTHDTDIKALEPHGTPMRGTDGANTTVPDAAGTVVTTDAASRTASKADVTALATAAAVAAIAADLPGAPTKNIAIPDFPFLMVLASDHVTGATGLTVTAERALNGGAFAACTNAVSEIGSGVYKIDLSAADMNADTVCLKFTATTAVDQICTIVTQPT